MNLMYQNSIEDDSLMMDRTPQFRLVSRQAILYARAPSHQDIARIHPLALVAWNPLHDHRAVHQNIQLKHHVQYH